MSDVATPGPAHATRREADRVLPPPQASGAGVARHFFLSPETGR